MDFRMEKNFDKQKTVWNISFFGEIDIFNSQDLKNELTELLNESPADLYVNCAELQYIDSTGLGALVGVLKSVKSHGKEMCLLAVKPAIAKLFHITNLDKVFVIEEAAKSGQEG